MIITSKRAVLFVYHVRFHSIEAAEAFAAELRGKDNVFKVVQEFTTVDFSMERAEGEKVAQEFEAGWVARMLTANQQKARAKTAKAKE